jgi:hypothetical protein
VDLLSVAIFYLAVCLLFGVAAALFVPRQHWLVIASIAASLLVLIGLMDNENPLLVVFYAVVFTSTTPIGVWLGRCLRRRFFTTTTLRDSALRHLATDPLA